MLLLVNGQRKTPTHTILHLDRGIGFHKVVAEAIVDAMLPSTQIVDAYGRYYRIIPLSKPHSLHTCVIKPIRIWYIAIR